MWRDQGKWVTCRKLQFLFSYTTVSKLQNTLCKPHYNWISGFRVMKNLTMLKQYETKEFEPYFCQYLKNNVSDIRLIPLDYVTYKGAGDSSQHNLIPKLSWTVHKQLQILSPISQLKWSNYATRKITHLNRKKTKLIMANQPRLHHPERASSTSRHNAWPLDGVTKMHNHSPINSSKPINWGCK